MAVFCKEHQPITSKNCKFLFSVLMEPFTECHTCNRKPLSYSSSEDDDDIPASDFEDLQEMIESVIRSRAMEAKLKRRGSMLSDSYSSVIHPTSGELFVGVPTRQSCDDCSAGRQENAQEDDEKEEFKSVQSHFSRCSLTSVDDTEAFYSVRTNLSRCSSVRDPDFADRQWWVSDGMDSSELRRRAIIKEVCHCKGWPFGLCRKALLLPPLPKSPAESWSWYKGSVRRVKTLRSSVQQQLQEIR